MERSEWLAIAQAARKLAETIEGAFENNSATHLQPNLVWVKALESVIFKTKSQQEIK